MKKMTGDMLHQPIPQAGKPRVLPEAPLSVQINCCAGVATVSREAALYAMKMCQIFRYLPLTRKR